jgi:mono/diheme cytochrome c family protein
VIMGGLVRTGEVGRMGLMERRGRMVLGIGRIMIAADAELGVSGDIPHSEVAGFRLAVARIPVLHGLVCWAVLGTQPRWGWWILGAVPTVGHRASGQPRAVFVTGMTQMALSGEVLVEPDPVKQFFADHCVRCHGVEKQKGDFRLDRLEREFTELAVAERWAEVLFRMNSGEMPPEDEKQPSAEELGGVVDWLSARLKEGEAARMAMRGPVTHYRLSRDEYGATVHDLLGVHYDVNLPGAFNEDPRWHGFERIGAMLSLSPSHVDRYLKAAETVLARAFAEKPVVAVKRRADAVDMRHRSERKRLEELGIADKVRAVVWPGGAVEGFRSYWFSEVRESGVYRARIRLSGLRGLDGRAPHLSVWDSRLKRSIYDEDIIAAEDKPVEIEFETFLDLPAELDFVNELSGAFEKTGNHTLNVLIGGGSIFTHSRETRRTHPTGYKLFDDEGRAIFPVLLVDSVEWEGPLTSEADLKKREGLVPAKDDLGDARECLKKFAGLAWRRPASEAEVDRYVAVVEREMAAGEKFAAAYRAAMVGVLASKNFFYLVEGSPGERRDGLDDWELASRLSCFLWGSMPDAALFAAAEVGTLRQPEVLRGQVRRMFGDAKIGRFTDAFPRQWLQLYKVGMFPPDPRLYPNYDLWLEKSMVLETTEYFAMMFGRNLPLREFLVSDWTMVNPRLAAFYGLPPLEASGFQRVALRPEDHRGGLLTNASVLMLTSDGTRHRPVHRGVWVSEAIFGRTPPPPPPNVEPLAPTPSDKPKATVRMQLEAHATNATCASCHRRIDPLGFAFEHYDAVGQWRTEERVATGQGGNPPVNASGTMPDGRAFTGPDGFKELLAQDVDRFAEAFVEQLATFGLRRVMTLDDRAQLKAIAAATKYGGYRLRDVIEQLVVSPLFQKR